MRVGCFVFVFLLAQSLTAVSTIYGSSVIKNFLPNYKGQDSYAPCVSYCETLYLVAWQSGRMSKGDVRKGIHWDGDIVGCRIDQKGKNIDEKSFVISDSDDLQAHVKIANNNSLFLVVWQDFRNGSDWDIYAARVTTSGEVLDPKGILVSGGSNNQAKPSVIWDGFDFVIVWQDFRSENWYEVYGCRISANGDVLDLDGIEIAVGNNFNCYAPVVSSVVDGQSFVIWVQQGLPKNSHAISSSAGVFMTRGKVNEEASYASNLKDARKHGPNGSAQPMSLCSGKHNFLAAWKTESSYSRGRAPNQSHVSLFDKDGNRIRSNKFLSKNKWNDRYIIDPSIAWSGNEYIVSWHEFVSNNKNECPHDEVFFARINEVGDIVGEVNHLSGQLKNPASKSSLASDTRGNVLFVYEYHPEDPDIPIRIACQLLKTNQ